MLVGRLGTIVSTNWLRDCLSNNTANKLRVLDATWARLQLGVGYEKFYLKTCPDLWKTVMGKWQQEQGENSLRSCQVLNVPEAENETADLYQYFETCSNFIDHNHSVLVFSDLGIIRSAKILIAYIMYKNKYSLEVAYKHMKSCCQFIRPYRNFIFQLSKWEQMIFNGDIITNVEDPNF